MTNLITEARELLRRAKTYLDATDGQRLDHLLRDGYDARYAELVCFSVAHLAELCDALEKAEEQNKQLMHEVCRLACESVERDRTLAKLEAEVEDVLREKQARESGCVYCINCPEKITAKKERYSHATETGIAYDNIKVNFCPMCGKKLPVYAGTIGGEIVQHALKELGAEEGAEHERD